MTRLADATLRPQIDQQPDIGVVPRAANVAEWRKQFLATEEAVYLDHAAVGPSPRVAVEAVVASLTSQARVGSVVHGKLHEDAETLRIDFARFIGAKPERVAAVSSTSAGISTVASGLDWCYGDNVVVPEIDFPSIVFPWMILADRGVGVIRVPCRNGRVEIQDLLRSATPRTRVIALSWVQFSSGYRVALDSLGEACQSRGIFLVVDGMQGIGALRLDIASLPVDAVATQSYKWLLAPQGVGWLYVSDALFERLHVSAAGVRTMTDRASYLDHSFALCHTAQRFESGILNFHGMQGAAESLALLKRIGADVVQERVLALALQLAGGLEAMGCTLSARFLHAKERSGIVVFEHPRRSSEECRQRLGDAGIVVGVREGRLRISPHFYNTEEEIDRVLSVLRE